MSVLSQRFRYLSKMYLRYPELSWSLAAVDQGSRQTLSWGLGRPRGYVPKQLSAKFFKEFIVKSLFLQYQLVQ